MDYVSLKPKARYAASEQQYTASGGEVQVLWGDIYRLQSSFESFVR